jgi:hypothetical protein
MSEYAQAVPMRSIVAIDARKDRKALDIHPRGVRPEGCKR